MGVGVGVGGGGASICVDVGGWVGGCVVVCERRGSTFVHVCEHACLWVQEDRVCVM